MPAKIIDRTGMIFGEWKILSFIERKSAMNYWLCRCSCGTTKAVSYGTLANGRSSSCGCKAIKKRVKKLTKHGMSGTSTYKSWHAMIQRTQGKGGHEAYVDKKISVCDEWLLFKNFIADMGLRPDGMSIDRIDNTKGYSKNNCRWATQVQQANNKETNVFIDCFGEKMTITQASRHYNIPISCLRHRLRKGMSVSDALTTPVIEKTRKKKIVIQASTRVSLNDATPTQWDQVR